MSARLKFRPWSTEEDDLLRQLCAGDKVKGPGWLDLPQYFAGRTVGACQQRWIVLRDGPKPAHTRKAQPLKPLPLREASLQQPIDLPKPASLTAFILGDPLPGRSALDRRLAAHSARQ